MWFANKQREVEELLAQYREKVGLCVRLFQGGFARYCETGDRDQLLQDVIQVHDAEHSADELRREIEMLLYAKALFPESRGDILELLESTDEVPNGAEHVFRSILDEHLRLPPAYHGKLMELVHLVSNCVDVMLVAESRLFSDFAGAAYSLGRIAEIEHQADILESQLIQEVFTDPEIPPMEKIQLRDLIRKLSFICNTAETVGERIRIFVAKRIT